MTKTKEQAKGIVTLSFNRLISDKGIKGYDNIITDECPDAGFIHKEFLDEVNHED